MGLNNLSLTTNLLAVLYSSSLINPDKTGLNQQPIPIQRLATDKIVESETPIETGLKWIGNNQKNILIIVDYDSAVHLPDEELSFLTNMLAACKLNLGDVAIVNKNNYKEPGYKDILAHFKSRIVFLFGVEPSVFGLPVSFPFFQVQSVAGCTFLYAPALEQQRNDTLLKSKLWVSLRNIFGI
jgi:hypothetical protein